MKPRQKKLLTLLGTIGAAIVLLAFGISLRNWQTVKNRPTVTWLQYSEETLATARAQGRPVLIEFYADWCVPCKEMDRYVFRHPDFAAAALAHDFVLVRADLTNAKDPQVQRIGGQFRVFGFPTVTFLDREGRERRELRLEGAIPEWNWLIKQFAMAMELVATGKPVPRPPLPP